MRFDLLNPSDFDPYALAVAAIAPRPIAWVGTQSLAGMPNLAPFSYFGLVASEPITFALGIAKRRGALKDTSRNLLETQVAVVHVATEPLAMPMLLSSADVTADVDEFGLAGLKAVEGDVVRAPRIAEAPIAFECRLSRHLELGQEGSDLFLLEAVVAHIRDEVLTDGLPDPKKVGFLGRLGGNEYCTVRDTITLRRPR